MIDYYNDFRQSVFSSLATGESEDYGSFDPLILAATLPDSIELNLTFEDEATTQRILAWGTYLHENIHWFQSIATTYGIIRLLAPMTQSISLYAKTREMSGSIICKPMHKFLTDCPPRGERDHEILSLAVNAWMNIEFANAYLESPDMHFERIRKSPFSVGLDIDVVIYIIEVMSILSACFPNSQESSDFLAELIEIVAGEAADKEERAISVPPVGACDIMEAAARLSEIQYIQRAFRGQLSWRDFKKSGYMEERYLKAFNLFLRVTRLELGDDPCGNVVNLFLVCCDIALNPAFGYPFLPSSRRDFLENWSPGLRFLKLCIYLRSGQSRSNWREISFEEEAQSIVDEICLAVRFETPTSIAEGCINFGGSVDSVKLTQLVESFDTMASNFPVRYAVGKHLIAMRARVARPLFFAVPAIATTGSFPQLEQTDQLLEALAPPFARRINRGIEAIKPRYFALGEGVLEGFHASFTKWLVVLSLGRQLAARRGPFIYALPWVDSTKTAAEIRDFVRPDFEAVSGVTLSEVEVLT